MAKEPTNWLLSLNFIHTLQKQRNYVKYPVYDGYSERIKVIKKFDRVINPIRFVNKEILELGLEKRFILSIIEKISIIPGWRGKEIKLENILNSINATKQRIRNYNHEKKVYSFKKTNFNEEPSNFWLRLILAPFTLGLSFIGYNSKKQASLNQKTNKNNREWNVSHKIEVDQQNSLLLQRITLFNKELNDTISLNWSLYHETKNQPIPIWIEDDEGWRDLKHSSNFSFSYLNDKKGVYIIRNKTKDRHYVGQSKNLGKRLNQHFLNGEVRKIEFARDWYDGDYFCYKYILCQTKDELDDLEKQKIDEFNAFYNKTRGNK